MAMIAEKRGWSMCSVHHRRTNQVECYWCLREERDLLRAEVRAGRPFLRPEYALNGKPYATRTVRPAAWPGQDAELAYAAARAALGDLDAPGEAGEGEAHE